MAFDLNALLEKSLPLPAGARVGTQKTGFDFNPNLANTIANANAASGATGSQGVQDLLANPAANTGFQTTLAGMLASLQGSEAQQRQDLADQFKAAGAEQSGAMGTAFANLAGQQANAHSVLAGEAMRSFLPSAVSGYGDLAKLGGPSLLEALKTGQSLDLANNAPAGGGGGGLQMVPDYHTIANGMAGGGAGGISTGMIPAGGKLDNLSGSNRKGGGTLF